MIKHLNKKGGNGFFNSVLAQTIDPGMGFNPFMSGKQELGMAKMNSSIRMVNQMAKEQERQRIIQEQRERQHIQNYLKNYNSCAFADEYTKKKISSLTFQQVKKLEQYNIFLHNLPFKQLVPNPDFEQKIGHNPFYMGKIDDNITKIPGGFLWGNTPLNPIGDPERNVYLDHEGFFYLGKFFGGLQSSQQCELEFEGNIPKSIPDPYFQQPQIRAGGSPIGSPPPPPPPPPPSLQQPQQQQQGPPPQYQQQVPPPQYQQQGHPPQYQQGPPPQQFQKPKIYIFKLYIQGNSSKGSGKPNFKKKPTTKKPITRKQAVKKPTTKKPTTKKPTVKKPTTKKPTVKKPTVKKPTTKKPTVKKPTTKKPTVKKPTTKKPAAKKPAAKKPAVKKTTTKKTTTKKPIKKTPVKKPIKKITTKK